MPHRRERLHNFRGLMCAALGFVGLVLLAMGFTIWQLRSDAIEDTYKDNGNVATVLAEQIAQTIRSVDLVIDDIQDRILLLAITTPEELRNVMSSEYGYAILKSRADRFAQADVITALDSTGRLLATSRAWPSSRVDLADRDYFQHFKGNGEKRTYISLPLANRMTGTPTVFFARPIRDDNDALLGLIVIGVPISQFRSIYQSVGLLGDHGFMLSRADGTILVRYPDALVLAGQRVPPSSPWFAAVKKGGGNFRSQQGIATDVRLVSVRLTPDYPLVVNIGISEGAALTVWRHRSAFIAAGTLLAMICSFFLLSAVSNRVRMLKESELSLAAKSRELEIAKAQTDAAVNNITQGICMFDSAQRLVVCNAQYLEMYGLPPDLIKPGCSFREILEYRKSLGNASDNAVQVLQGKIFSHTATLPDGRIIAVVVKPTLDGGWVATHEDITERHRTEALIAHMARHDVLTDLPNRLEFEQRLSEALTRLNRHSEAFAVLMLDLDKFKAVNDTLGHPVGDELLKAVAGRLRSCTRELDTAARLGGDEFVILQAHVGDPYQAARTLANRLLDVMAEPIMLGAHQVQVGLSIGIALAPRDGSGIGELLKNSDLALYRAKAEGRNRFRFFDATRDAPATPETKITQRRVG